MKFSNALRVLTAAFLFASFLTYCSKTEKAVPENAIITALNGKVTLTSAEGKSRSLAQGDVKSPQGIIIAGDTVRTEASSGIDLQFRDGSVVRIYENSEFHLTSLMVSPEGNTRQIKGSLKSGGLYTLVYPVKDQSEYKIITPTAVAGVRGTGFEVEADEESTDVLVTEGVVEVENTVTGEKAELTENQEITASRSPGMIVREANKERVRIIKESQEEIRRIREESKAEMQKIRDSFKDQKSEIRSAFDEQKKEIRDQFEGSKEEQREQFDSMKADIKVEQERVKDEAKAAVSEQKEAQKDAVKNQQSDTKSQMDAIKSAKPQPGSVQ